MRTETENYFEATFFWSPQNFFEAPTLFLRPPNYFWVPPIIFDAPNFFSRPPNYFRPFKTELVFSFQFERSVWAQDCVNFTHTYDWLPRFADSITHTIDFQDSQIDLGHNQLYWIVIQLRHLCFDSTVYLPCTSTIYAMMWVIWGLYSE